MDFTQDVVIDKPIDEVAERLADPDHVRHWHRDLVNIERLSGEPGAAGSKSALSYDNKGRKFRLEETILVNDLPSETVATYETSGMKHTLTTRLEAISSASTSITISNHMELSGMAKLAGPVLAGTLKKQTDKRLLDLKRWLETGSAEPE